MITVEKLMPNSLPDNLMWGWINLVQNEFTGGGTIPDVYKKACQIQKLGTDLLTPTNTWNYTGVWPSKINGIELDRVSSENTIETIEFCVDKEAKF
jgi:hypothetical protein